MPSYTDPGFFCKCFCAPCAVHQAQGCKCPELWFAMALGPYYTMCCWDPTTGIKNVMMANVTEKDEPASGAPSGVEIVR
mgnify:FL=1|tara:strand:- start:703 stop:939 length:237 start_codon:yes stop_codon:yes gene_type:complete|eukprot:scaffold8850_cov72-Phaeocystis_antarctica.AAC.7